MKIMKGVCIVFCTSMLCMDGLAEDSVRIGTNTLFATFDDTELSVTNRSLILADVSRVFAVFDSIGDLFPMRDGDFQVDMLRKSPEALPERFRPYPVLTRTNGLLQLVMPRRLTNTYTNALTFIETHRAAVTNAYAWIDWINSGDVTNASYQDKCELAFSSITPTLTANAADNLAGSLFITHPCQPSILDFATETLPTGDAVITTWARIPYREDGEADASVFPMVLHNGKWKYYLRR